MAPSDNTADSTGTELTKTEPNEAPVSAQEPPQTSGSSGAFTLILAFLAFLLGGAAAGWQGYQYWLGHFAPVERTWLSDIEGLETRVEAQLGAQRSQQQALSKNVAASQQGLQDQIQTIQAETEAALAQQLQSLTWVKQRQQALDERLQDLVKVSREDWILAEADYLLRLAQQRLQLGGSGRDAEPLMMAAQRNLQLVHSSGIKRVKDVLAADAAALKEALQFDLSGLNRRLEAVAAQAQELMPLGDRTLKAQPLADAPAAPEFALENVWPLIKYGFARTADKLQSYIRISDRDSEYQKTVIAGGQRELFRQNLQLLFEQARWALLSGNGDLYRQSLARAEQWLRQYYVMGEAELAVVEELTALQQQPVRAPLPPISGSIAALQDFIDSRHGAAEATQ